MTATAKSSGAQPPEDNEISLYELWQILIDGWRWIGGGALLGLIGAAGYLGVTPPQFEAAALVQIAQAELPARAIERVKLAGFQDTVLKTLGWSQDSRSVLYRSSLKVVLGKSTDLIDLKVRAFSREDAERAIKATIEHLAAVHQEITRSTTRSAAEKARGEMAGISAEIGEVEFFLSKLDRLTKEIPASSHLETLTALSMVDAQKSRLRRLRDQEAAVKEQLLPSRPSAPTATLAAAETAAIERPSVSEEPVFPRWKQTLVLATLGGLFLGVMAAVWRHGWQNRRSAVNFKAAT